MASDRLFWTVFCSNNGNDTDVRTIIGEVWHSGYEHIKDQKQYDMDLITHAPEDIKFLLDGIDRLEAKKSLKGDAAK